MCPLNKTSFRLLLLRRWSGLTSRMVAIEALQLVERKWHTTNAGVKGNLNNRKGRKNNSGRKTRVWFSWTY